MTRITDDELKAVKSCEIRILKLSARVKALEDGLRFPGETVPLPIIECQEAGDPGCGQDSPGNHQGFTSYEKGDGI